MSFQLVPKSVTLNDLERRNGCHFWATVCKTVRPMLSVRCLYPVCLSVTLVHCGQTVG